IVEARDDAAQIADPVGVRIGEASRVDLIDDAFPPPDVGVLLRSLRAHGKPAPGTGTRTLSIRPARIRADSSGFEVTAVQRKRVRRSSPPSMHAKASRSWKTTSSTT